jgi:hypothetical protein
MITSVLLSSLALAGLQGQPTMLSRKFVKGEKLTYDVKSHLQTEVKVQGVNTFIPSDLDLDYSFTVEVTEMKADGIAVVRYRRPTMKVVEGETFDAPPKTYNEKVNYDMILTVSPINEIMEMKDFATASKGKWVSPFAGGAVQGGGDFMGEVQRLALFAGSFDNALDFTPKLPFSEVKPGDSWKRTVGYQPQKLKGTEQTVVQRLDYNYTYKGKVTVNGKPFERVEATLSLNTDFAAFYNQYLPEDGLRIAKLPVKLDAKIEYDLDPKKGHVVAARAESTGSTFVTLTDAPNRRLEEQRLKGRTSMAIRVPAPAKKG